MMKKICTLLLAVCMVTVMMPAMAFADGESSLKFSANNLEHGRIFYKVGNEEAIEVTSTNNQEDIIINSLASNDTNPTIVTISATPNDGYRLDSINVYESDGKLAFNGNLNNDGTYSFPLKGGTYTVAVSFVEQSTPQQNHTSLKFNASDLADFVFTYKIDVPNGNGFTEGTEIAVDGHNAENGSVWVRDVTPGSRVTVTVSSKNTANSLDTIISGISATEGDTDGASPAYDGKFNFSDDKTIGTYTFIATNADCVYSVRVSGVNDNKPSQPDPLDSGDFAINVFHYENGSVEYKVGEGGKWIAVKNGRLFISGNDFNVTDGTKIYLKANPASEGPYTDFDKSEGQNFVNNTNLSEEDLSSLTGGTYSFVYSKNAPNRVQIAFEGSNKPVTEVGTLDVDVTLKFWIYDSTKETYSEATNSAGMAGIRLNGFNAVMQNGSDTIIKGGHALKGTTNNTLTLQDEFGSKSNRVFLVDVSQTDTGTTVTPTANGEFSRNAEDQPYAKELAPAETYNIAIEPGISNDLTIIWTTNPEIADEWNAPDMYVENGRVEVLKITRGNEDFYDAERDGTKSEELRNKGINISDDFGHLTLKRGDNVVLKLIPDYGYQLKRVGGENQSLAESMGMVPAKNEISTFTISDLQHNIHFAAVFEKADNHYKVEGTNVSGVTVSNDNNAIKSGTLSVSVSDTATEDVSSLVSGDAKTVDIRIDNIISKGNDDSWISTVTELNNTVGVTLSTNIEAGEEYSVVRNHEGKLTEIPCIADAENNTISFNSDMFSTYTIVKKGKSPSQPGGSSGGGGSLGGGSSGGGAPDRPEPEDGNITNSGSETGGNALTTVELKNNITEAEGRPTFAVNLGLGEKIVENAVKNGSINIVIQTASKTGASESTTVTLSSATVADIANTTSASVTFQTASAEVMFDRKSVAAVSSQAGTDGYLSFIAETTENSKKKVEVNLKIETSNGPITNFNDGNVTVTVPVNDALASKNLTCVYIDDNGKFTRMGGALLAGKKLFKFNTTHFSTYAILEEAEADAIIAKQNIKVGTAGVKLYTAKGGKLRVKASAKNATGYKVYYKKSSWKNYKTYTKGKVKTLDKTFKKLSKGKYTVKVKAYYKDYNGTGDVTWGKLSSAKKITVRR